MGGEFVVTSLLAVVVIGLWPRRRSAAPVEVEAEAAGSEIVSEVAR